MFMMVHWRHIKKHVWPRCCRVAASSIHLLPAPHRLAANLQSNQLKNPAECEWVCTWASVWACVKVWPGLSWQSSCCRRPAWWLWPWRLGAGAVLRDFKIPYLGRSLQGAHPWAPTLVSVPSSPGGLRTLTPPAWRLWIRGLQYLLGRNLSPPWLRAPRRSLTVEVAAETIRGAVAPPVVAPQQEPEADSLEGSGVSTPSHSSGLW